MQSRFAKTVILLQIISQIPFIQSNESPDSTTGDSEFNVVYSSSPASFEIDFSKVIKLVYEDFIPDVQGYANQDPSFIGYKKLVRESLPETSSELAPNEYEKEKLQKQIFKLLDSPPRFTAQQIERGSQSIHHLLDLYLEILTPFIEIFYQLNYFLNETLENPELKINLKRILGYGKLTGALISYRNLFYEKFREMINHTLMQNLELTDRDSIYYQIKNEINSLLSTVWKETPVRQFKKNGKVAIISGETSLERPENLLGYVYFQVFWVYFALFENVFDGNGMTLNTNLAKYNLLEEHCIPHIFSSLASDSMEIAERKYEAILEFIQYLKYITGFKGDEIERESWGDYDIFEALENVKHFNILLLYYSPDTVNYP